MAVTQDDKLYGKIAVKNRILSEGQLQGFMEAKQNLYPGRDLGDIVLEAGAINEKQHRAILRAMDKVRNRNESLMATATQEMPAVTESLAHIQVRAVEAAATVTERAAAPAASPEPAGAVDVAAMLAKAREMGASDIHLSAGIPPTLRLHGRLAPFNRPPLSLGEARLVLARILTPEQRKLFEERGDLDLAYELSGVGRFRVNCYRHQRGVGATFRLISETIPTLDELGLPEHLAKFTTYHQGMVLVTGPAGSGKSSTLAALLEIVNRERHDHIITVEDPIEYVFVSKGCNVTQRQVEVHTEGWGKAIRAALREDPDVIMIGEMRDLDTISTAITAAETGHLVFGTLHTTNAIRSVDRVLDVFPPQEQPQIRAMLSESLRGVISQQLVPRADGKGRCVALEVLYVTPAVANLVRESKTFQLESIMQAGRKHGMVLMDDALGQLLESGAITREEAQFRASNPKRFGETD